jgi:hypothetical protein
MGWLHTQLPKGVRLHRWQPPSGGSCTQPPMSPGYSSTAAYHSRLCAVAYARKPAFCSRPFMPAARSRLGTAIQSLQGRSAEPGPLRQHIALCPSSHWSTKNGVAEARTHWDDPVRAVKRHVCVNKDNTKSQSVHVFASGNSAGGLQPASQPAKQQPSASCQIQKAARGFRASATRHPVNSAYPA